MKTLKRRLSVFLVILSLHVPVFSQHDHNVAANVIDGAVHPELISDITAYRLFFLVIANGQSSSDVDEDARQRAFMRMSGLADQDVDTALSIANDFKVKYSQLIEQYNASVLNSNAVSTEARRNFLAERDALVQATRHSLASMLSPQGMQNVDNYVKAEKRHITAAQEEQ